MLREAGGLFEQHRYVEARNILGRYLDQVRDDPEAFFLLAQVAEKLGDKPNALKAYSQVVALRPENVDARKRAARLFLDLGDIDQAENVLKYVKEFRPRDPDLLTLEAAIFDRRGETAQAIERAEQLVKSSPEALDPVLLLNELYGKAGKWAEAESLVRGAMERRPEEIALRYALAVNLLNQDRLNEAEQLLRRLVEDEPDVLLYAGRLAELYTAQRRWDEAEDLLRRSIQRDPDDERRLIVLSNFLAKTRGAFVAEEELVNAIFARPQTVMLRIALGDLYEVMLNLDGAERLYREAATVAREPVQKRDAMLRAASVLLRLGEVNGAEPLVQQVLKEDPGNGEARLLHGKIAIVRQQFDVAIDDFRAVLQKHPESLEILGMLVRAYVASGQAGLAEQGLRSAVKLDPTQVGMRLELVQLLGMQRRYRDALEELNDLLERVPNQIDAMLRRTDLYVALNEWEKALESAREIRDHYPDDASGYLQLGNIYFMQTQYDRAADAFRLALERFPLEYNALNSLSQAIFVKEGPAAAKRYLEGFLEAYPNHPTGYNVLGEVYFQENEHSKAEAAFIKAYQLNPTWLEPYKNLARLYESRGEFEAVIQTYLNGLMIVPDNVQLAYQLAKAYENTGKDDDAIATYEGILAKRPYIDSVANSLAALLLRQDDSRRDMARIWELVEGFESVNNALYLDTLGWAYYYRKEYDKAQHALFRSLEIAPNLIDAKYHLGMVFYALGDRDNASKWLGEALATRVYFHGYSDAKSIYGELKKGG